MPTVLSSEDESLREWTAKLEIPGVRPLDQPALLSADQSRRANYRRRGSPVDRKRPTPEQKIFSLVREGGVLRWRAGAIAPSRTGRRAGGRAALPAGSVVRQFAFEKLEGSQVYSTLVAIDKQLTPDAAYAGNAANGLRQWKNGNFRPFPDSKAAGGKNVLLFIHGTFSKNEALLANGLDLTSDGKKLLADAEKHYDLVLAFDHPTLSVSPAMNAFDLAALLRPTPAKLDIVCHSRGGLVARWFCEGFADPAIPRRAMLVGSPLAGTSLAAAPRLRATMEYLSTVSDFLRKGANLASSASPIFVAVSGLMRVISAVTDFAAKTPLFDGALALIPGLDAQSRTGNNEEIRRLRQNTGNSNFSSNNLQYFAIQSNFEPQAIGWNFLRVFNKPLQRVANVGADLIFVDQEGVPQNNDLVVDTISMSEVADLPAARIQIVKDFGTSDVVHHLNYFHQPETVQAIRTSFGVP